jgi:hypothetical protein
MAKVDPTGVVFSGVCHIQTDRCMAREWGPLTAVWGPPGRTQVNVCGACLEEMVRTHAWDVEGARLLPQA